jgi:hypothetical protein
MLLRNQVEKRALLENLDLVLLALDETIDEGYVAQNIRLVRSLRKRILPLPIVPSSTTHPPAPHGRSPLLSIPLTLFNPTNDMIQFHYEISFILCLNFECTSSFLLPTYTALHCTALHLALHSV